MPNIKSAKKRTLVIEKKTAQNKMIKSEVKKAAATEMFPSVCSLIDGAVTKGVYKKNTAANKKSGLAKKLNAMA